MYLISLYFDEKTDNRISQYIQQVAKASGNTYMLDGNVPPHMTISAFETREEEQVVAALEGEISKMKTGTVQWASVGQFFPYVLFISPVLNEYLYSLSIGVYDILYKMNGVSISRFYKPFQWMPHTTIGKKLNREEMEAGFRVLQNSFGMFDGQVTRIGLAKTNPYRDIASWKLKE